MQPKPCRTFGSSDQKGGDMIKARIFHLAVVACLVAFVVLAAAAALPTGMADGAD